MADDALHSALGAGQASGIPAGEEVVADPGRPALLRAVANRQRGAVMRGEPAPAGDANPAADFDQP
ncbi:MAG: hypothetical protein Q8S27_18590, partial [Hoeflea sp.]|nr:hypothetical protein [Hoeflea sp.]